MAEPANISLPLDVACYLMGFVDGEGCFYIAGPAKKGGYRPGFVIKLRADDKAVLDWLCARTGLGKVRRCGGADGRQVGNRCPQVMWAITRKDDVLAFRDIFDRYRLKSKKGRDFAIWARAVDIWRTVELASKTTDWSGVAEAKRELSAVKRFSLELAA